MLLRYTKEGSHSEMSATLLHLSVCEADQNFIRAVA